MSNQVQLTVFQRKQQAKEENLRLLVQKAREREAGIQNTAAEDGSVVRERDQLCFLRHKERECV